MKTSGREWAFQPGSRGEQRVLLTEDRDFGELVYVRGRPSAGVVLMRFPGFARIAKPMTVVEAVAKLGPRLKEGFAVVEPGRVRLSGGG